VTVIDPLFLAGAKARGKRPVFFADRDVERLLNVVMALAQEVSVMRERLDTVERLLSKKGLLMRSDIDAFEPTKAEAEERNLATQEFIARILRIIQQEREAIDFGDESAEEVADELAKG
jgi:predicted  nucleic acid-binding Zn-ribbon protein